jgi:FKBP-type peptidyl-prolyl cis-trans isomerase
MKFPHLFLILAAALGLVACNDNESPELGFAAEKELLSVVGAEESTMETEIEKFSYIVGGDVGLQFFTSDTKIDQKAFALGMADALNNQRPRISKEDAVKVVENYYAAQQEKTAKYQEEMNATAEKNIQEGKKFLSENSTKNGVVTTETGLQYKIIIPGAGASPAATSRVLVHYRGTFIDGREFDTSSKHGGSVELSLADVIPGWTEALQKMKEGAKWELYLHPELAYGPQGQLPTIGPMATLVFEVELEKVLTSE